jgi:hypothetical protein
MSSQKKTVGIVIIIGFLIMTFGPPAFAKSPLDGSINVINKRDISVQVTIDGKTFGEVSPRGLRTFKSVPNGLRILSVSARNQRSITSRVQVPVAGRVSYTVVRRDRRVTLTNPNERDMWLVVDGVQKQMIRSKGTASIPLRFGTHRLGVRPVGSSNTRTARMTITVHRDASPMIQLPIYFGKLKIQDSRVDRATIFVGGQQRGSIFRGASVTLRNIEPGRHRVELRHRGRTTASTLIEFHSGRTQTWAPNVGRKVSSTVERKATLKIVNPRMRPIQFQINGRRPVTVAAHSHTLVRNLPVGEHQITWRGPRGRERSDFVRVAPNGATFTIGAGQQSGRPARRR